MNSLPWDTPFCTKPKDSFLAFCFIAGHNNDTGHRYLLMNQTDVHRKFTVSLDKFFGSIQGIDDPQHRPVLALSIISAFSFFTIHIFADTKHADRFAVQRSNQSIRYQVLVSFNVRFIDVFFPLAQNDIGNLSV
ncbi:hypothetical protein M2243_000222 [Heliophilum fasciatum]|nr:hypothetical protein [Heliophilum fasciatum]MCW2276807.1 hypothetical protein [Heliophilum fasciatum]